MNLKNIVECINYGDHPKEDLLDEAITHYQTLVDHLAVHGSIYQLAWEHAYIGLETLKRYKQRKAPFGA